MLGTVFFIPIFLINISLAMSRFKRWSTGEGKELVQGHVAGKGQTWHGGLTCWLLKSVRAGGTMESRMPVWDDWCSPPLPDSVFSDVTLVVWIHTVEICKSSTLTLLSSLETWFYHSACCTLPNYFSQEEDYRIKPWEWWREIISRNLCLNMSYQFLWLNEL